MQRRSLGLLRMASHSAAREARSHERIEHSESKSIALHCWMCRVDATSLLYWVSSVSVAKPSPSFGDHLAPHQSGHIGNAEQMYAHGDDEAEQDKSRRKSGEHDAEQRQQR